MFNKVTFLTLSFSVFLSLLASTASAEDFPLPDNLIALGSSQGEQLLFASTARADYLPLTQTYVTQANLAYCGVASSVMVLNALKASAPKAEGYRGYRFFDQKNFFSKKNTQTVKTSQQVSRGGMTLNELSNLLRSHELTVNTYHAEDSTIDEFRKLAIANLGQADDFMLVNYLRKSLGQKSGGHISPLAAYDQASDRFLILDVARYKYPSVWVTATDLFNAMNTQDRSSGQSRGFVLVKN